MQLGRIYVRMILHKIKIKQKQSIKCKKTKEVRKKVALYSLNDIKGIIQYSNSLYVGTFKFQIFKF